MEVNFTIDNVTRKPLRCNNADISLQTALSTETSLKAFSRLRGIRGFTANTLLTYPLTIKHPI